MTPIVSKLQKRSDRKGYWFATDVTTERTLMAAGGVLAVIPPLLLALVFHRLIVQGLTAGAVKD